MYVVETGSNRWYPANDDRVFVFELQSLAD